MTTVTIPKRITKGEELVIVPSKDFEAFRRWQIEAKDALAKVARGRREYRQKKTIVATSPKELL